MLILYPAFQKQRVVKYWGEFFDSKSTKYRQVWHFINLILLSYADCKHDSASIIVANFSLCFHLKASYLNLWWILYSESLSKYSTRLAIISVVFMYFEVASNQEIINWYTTFKRLGFHSDNLQFSDWFYMQNVVSLLQGTQLCFDINSSFISSS